MKYIYKSKRESNQMSPQKNNEIEHKKDGKKVRKAKKVKIELQNRQINEQKAMIHFFLLITLNLNGETFPIKSNKVDEWIETKQNETRSIYLLSVRDFIKFNDIQAKSKWT